MGLTPHYGLNYFGGEVPGTIVDGGGKHTGADRLFIDRALHALAAGKRHYRATDITKTATPTATVGTGGFLPNGGVRAYRVTLVDAEGFERPASDEVRVVLPELLDPPDLPNVVSAQGNLAEGLYYYAFTALSADQESVLGQAATASVVAGFGGVSIGAPAYDQGARLQLWRRKEVEPGWSRITVLDPGTDFLDNGSIPAEPCACDPGKQPPTVTTTTGRNAVTVTLHPDDAAAVRGGAVRAWRLYATTVPGFYSGRSLVHEVVETVDETAGSPRAISWVDDGTEIVTGAPPVGTQQLSIAPYTIEQAETLPDAAPYPPGYPVHSGGQLYVRAATADWTPVTPRGPLAYSGAEHPQLHPDAPFGSEGDLYLRHDPAQGRISIYRRDATTWTALGDPIGGTAAPAPAPSVYTSPNGTRHRLVVADDGTVGTVVTTEPGVPGSPTSLEVI